MNKLIEAQKKQFMSIPSFALHPKGAILLPVFIYGIATGSQAVLFAYFGLLFLAYKYLEAPVEEKDKLLHFMAYYYTKRFLKKLGKMMDRRLERFMLWW